MLECCMFDVQNLKPHKLCQDAVSNALQQIPVVGILLTCTSLTGVSVSDSSSDSECQPYMRLRSGCAACSFFLPLARFIVRLAGTTCM